MRNRSMGTTLGCVALVTLGFIVGTTHTPNETHAQEPASTNGNDFVVVSGYGSGADLEYFVVTADGSARPVKVKEKPLRTPVAQALRVEHSGRVRPK